MPGQVFYFVAALQTAGEPISHRPTFRLLLQVARRASRARDLSRRFPFCRFAPNLRRLEDVSEAEAFCRNPEQSEGPLPEYPATRARGYVYDTVNCSLA